MVIKIKEEIIVGTHASDIDGITSAALIIKKFPNAKIIFTKPNEILRMTIDFDFVIDLPKPRKCRINIDHHESNYRRLVREKRLTENDLVDPSAPSAASLVAQYFNLNDRVSKELVQMANKADRGDFDDDLMILDLLIKTNISQKNKLLWLAKKLSMLGKEIFRDKDFLREAEKLRPLIDLANNIKDIVLGLLRKGIRVAIFDATRVPYALSKVAPTIFAKKGGDVAMSYYIDPDTGKIRVSIRVGDYDFKANEFAEMFGGGGHEKAAGITLIGEGELAVLITKFIDIVRHSVIFVKL